MLIAWLCALGFIITLLTYQPGYMSFDTLKQLREARSMEFSDGNPVVMAAIWSAMERVSAGPFGMLVLQNMLYWGGLALFFRSVRGPGLLRVLMVIVIGAYPPIFGQIGTVWKDLLMLGAGMLAIGMIASTLAARTSGRPWLRLIGSGTAILLLLWLAVSLRHNSLPAVVPLVYWLFQPAPAYARSIRRVGMHLGAALAVSAALYVLSGFVEDRLVSKHNHFWQVLASFDLVGTSVEADKVVFEGTLDIFETEPTVAELKAVYTPLTVGALYRARSDSAGERLRPLVTYVSTDEQLERLASAWRSAIYDHPSAYLQHRWQVFRHVLGLVDRPVYDAVFRTRILKNEMGFTFHASAWNEWLTERLLAMSASSWVYRVWVYAIVLVVAFGFGCVRYWYGSDLTLLVLSTSGLLYLLGYFPTAGSPPLRYNLWTILMALLCTYQGLAWLLSARSPKAATPAPTAPKPAPQTEPAPPARPEHEPPAR